MIILYPFSCNLKKLLDLDSPLYICDVKSVKGSNWAYIRENVYIRLSGSIDEGLPACSFPVLHPHLLLVFCGSSSLDYDCLCLSDAPYSLAALEIKASSLCKSDRLEVGNGILFSEVTNIYLKNFF